MSIDGAPSPGHDDDTRVAGVHDSGRRAEQAIQHQASQNDAGRQQRPESLTREEYADAMRESGPPIQRSRDDHQAEPRGQADVEARRPADHDPAEPADPDAHGTGMRAESAERQRTDLTEADPRDGGSDPDPRADDDLGSGTAGDGAGAPAETDATASAVTHFHSEFKGRPMDLYTDGTRWAAADQVRMEDTVGGRADVPDRAPPSGEELVDSAGEDSSRLEKFRRELYKTSDDAVDAVEKDATLVHDAFWHPPTSSYQVTPVDGPYISEAQHSGIDAGTVATAVFAIGVLIDRGVNSFVRHSKEHAKGE